MTPARAELEGPRRFLLAWMCWVGCPVFSAMAQPGAPEPGLMAEYRALDSPSDTPLLLRLDAKPAFSWGNSSPHPRIPSEPFRVTWKGLIDLKEGEAIRFFAFVGGELTLRIAGAEIFSVRETNSIRRIDSPKTFKRDPGNYPLQIEFRSLPGVPARIQIGWEGDTFSAEPLPASRLQHIPSQLPANFQQHAKIEDGREWVRQLGCAQCHRQAFPSVADVPPGPSLTHLPSRIRRDWLAAWLDNPGRIRSQARMPKLFSSDREGAVEIAVISDYLLRDAANHAALASPQRGDHRAGRQSFVGLGCATCHTLPEPSDGSRVDAAVQRPARLRGESRSSFDGLADRFNAEQLAAFIADPRSRYPDGRMPRLPVTAAQARDIAAYLLLWSRPLERRRNEPAPPSDDEIKALAQRLKVAADRKVIGQALFHKKRCSACHTGLPESDGAPVPLRQAELARSVDLGCLGNHGLPQFDLPASAREKIAAFASVAGAERSVSPFEERQQLLMTSGCFLCHQSDGEAPPQIEAVGQTLWSPHLMRLPYQRTPRLAGATSKYARAYLIEALRDGASGHRPSWYSYRMPAYGEQAEQIAQALAERDGELAPTAAPATPPAEDPAIATLGGGLIGFEGYACIACHIWKGRELTSVDPGAIGPELTTLTRRIQRPWFDRWLENPARVHPGTPMPAFFAKGQPAPIGAVLEGDLRKQKDALWAYLSQGTNAPSPQPRSSIPIILPNPGSPPLVAQIPVRLADGETLESLCLQYGNHDLVIYDLGKATLHSVRSGSQILRNPNGWRTFLLSETGNILDLAAAPAFHLLNAEGAESTNSVTFQGYDRLPAGARIRFEIVSIGNRTAIAEVLQVEAASPNRRLKREWHVTGLPFGHSLRIRIGLGPLESDEVDPANFAKAIYWKSARGHASLSSAGKVLSIVATPDAKSGSWSGEMAYRLPPPGHAKVIPPAQFDLSMNVTAPVWDDAKDLYRPGYRAIRFAMPTTADGEDRVMPSALAVDPRTGQLFVASLKLGELFVLRDPASDGREARFQDFAGGLFQEAYSMLHDGEALYVLHRRNLTRILDADRDGKADRFDRVAALPHRAGNSYDWGYGLVRDQAGGFILSFAPHADNRDQPGMGGVLRLEVKDGAARFTELAFGLRNAFGWTIDSGGEVFFSDNQGEWVAANKLGHLMPNRYYGYPNSARKELARQPRGETAVWVPYAWAKSINGIAYDPTGGQFGPFGGQIFMAELMHGGAIIRANVEKINGVFQGACFPFWGRGLLGPLVLTFDPRGPLYVGSITQPGWMAQPDRGALFRIEFTGSTPFEIQSIHARPAGFRLKFTKPILPEKAAEAASYLIEHYRYEYTGAYGSPELDRTRVQIKRIHLVDGNRAVDLITEPLIAGRIYSITAGGITDPNGERLVHPTGVYTLNQVPKESQAASLDVPR